MVVGDLATGIEVLVVGGGPGGYVAAIRAAQLGKDVTLVDRAGILGGICLNHGCIPSKALIHAADLYDTLRSAEEMGIMAKGLSVDLRAMMSWKAGVVGRLTDGVSKLCKGNGVDVIYGDVSFVSKRKALISRAEGVQNVEFEKANIATGSSSVDLPGMQTDGEVILSSTEALALPDIPERFIVVGGGYIGIELGTFYAKIGSHVTIIEMMDTLLPGQDPDLVRIVSRRLKAIGVETLLSAKVKAMGRSSEGVKVEVSSGNGSKSLAGDKVLVAVGRRPNSDGLGLEKIGIELDERGFIRIDDRCRTSVPHIYAIGDVAGEPLLAHKASREGIVAAEAIGGLKTAREWQSVPAVIFSDPEIATVGISEEEAAARGLEVDVGRFPFSASGKALAINRSEGFVKIVAERSTKRILGVRIVGPEASTMISEGALAVEMAATLDDVALTIHPHPTLPETLMEAAESAEKKAIHILNR